MLEAHFSGLPSQSSIYGMTCLEQHVVLVASSKRKVYFVDCCRNNEGHLVASMKEVAFTYIPSGAEIISINAFYQDCYGYIVGITFVKSDSSGKLGYYFNIYSTWEPNKECNLDVIAQGCLTLSLDFVPFHLTHTAWIDQYGTEIVWLLSGSDCKVHLYREDKYGQYFCEETNEDYFPEFKNLDSVVVWMDFLSMTGSRITAFGCKNGTVVVAVVSISPEIKITSMWSIEHDGPISSVRLFQDVGSDVLAATNEKGKELKYEGPIHLLVGNTLEVSVVYRDILKKGLSLGAQWMLPNSGKYDCVTCAYVADIDMDGENELLLGTYGQQLLVYKWWPESRDNKGEYCLFYKQTFANPILSVMYVDITKDGLREMLVLSTKGLHILQHNLKNVTELCLQRLKELVDSKHSKSVTTEDNLAVR